MANLFDSPWKLMIVAAVIIVLFGSRKLPDAARSLGKSMRILKTEVQGLHEDEPATPATTNVQAAPAQLQATPPATPDSAPQAQIAALQAQLNNLQQSVAASNGTATDSQQTR
jgi:sec-independent protein translocase protein TatA